MSIQERFGALEAEAKGRIRRALSTGNAKLLELDGALAKVAKDDWTVPGLRRQLDQLKARAESLRATAVKRAQAMPGEAVTKLATGTRTPLQNLARGLADIAKKLERARPGGEGGRVEGGAEGRTRSRSRRLASRRRAGRRAPASTPASSASGQRPGRASGRTHGARRSGTNPRRGPGLRPGEPEELARDRRRPQPSPHPVRRRRALRGARPGVRLALLRRRPRARGAGRRARPSWTSAAAAGKDVVRAAARVGAGRARDRRRPLRGDARRTPRATRRAPRTCASSAPRSRRSTLPDASADVVVSNCAINHAPDKEAVYREIHRVLRPGGRFVVSDVIAERELPEAVRSDPAAWAACYGGAIPEADYLAAARRAGFAELQVLERTEPYDKGGVRVLSLTLRGTKR